mgnify:CR=1 FL=1
MTTYARRIAASPARTASDTWRAIADLIASDDGAAHEILVGVVNPGALLIADEATASSPLVLVGAGPRLNVYTVHGTDAANGDNVNEAPVSGLDLNGAWTLYLPDHPTEPGLISALVNDAHIVIGAPPAPTPTNSGGASGSRIGGVDLSALETS